VSPESGVIPAGSSLTLDVIFNASGLNGGDYKADIIISNNDPDESSLAVPTNLHVTGAPDIAASATSLDYGEVFIGVSVLDTVIISNTGTDLLTISAITSDRPEYTGNFTAFTLNPGEAQPLYIT
jgi:hypothetical protein